MTQKKKAFMSSSSKKASATDLDGFLNSGRADKGKKTLGNKHIPPVEETKSRGRGRPKKELSEETRATTLYLQDELLDELTIMAMTWYRETKQHDNQEKLSTSAMLRAVLHVTMDALRELDQVANEQQLRDKLVSYLEGSS